MKIAFLFAPMLGAALCLAPAASSASEIRLCTGGSSGVYFAAGHAIANMAGKTATIKVVESGGTIDNLERMLDLPPEHADACDAMIGQPDGPTYIARSSPAKVRQLRQIATLHREYLHVFCNKASGVDDLSDLPGGKNYKVAIGEPGSGAWLIWQNILAEDSSYESVPTVAESGDLALSAVASGDTTCMIFPGGLKNGTAMDADAIYGENIVLAGATDKDFNDAIDFKGEQLYDFQAIPDSTYRVNLQAGWFTSVKTISWNAAVYINTERFDNKLLNAFTKSTNRAASAIRAEYGK